MSNEYEKIVLSDGTTSWKCLRCATQIQSRTIPFPRSHQCLSLTATPVARPSTNGVPGTVSGPQSPIPSPFLQLPMFGGHGFTPSMPYPEYHARSQHTEETSRETRQ